MISSLENNQFINLKTAQAKMVELYNIAWRVDIEDKVKLRNYSELKTKIGTEGYIKLNMKKSRRSLIGQIRMGSLKLGIETGRYYGIPRHERLCKLCKTDKIEDELHFLFNCEAYVNVRNELYHELPEILNYILDVDLFRYLNEKPNIFGKYIENIWKEWTTLLSKTVNK